MEYITNYYYTNTNKIDYLQNNPEIIDVKNITTGSIILDFKNGQSYLISGNIQDFLENGALQLKLKTGTGVNQ
jgi:hypothetical protein